MKIISPSVEILTHIDPLTILGHIEKCGRTCYKSEQYITNESCKKFVKNLIDSKHESVLEHSSISAKIICDRGIMAELTRHRLASFSVESSRYCNYSKDKFGGELTFIKPLFWNDSPHDRNMDLWTQAMMSAEQYYLEMIENGAKPEEARSVLPNSLKTEIVMTANLRELRHILKLRTNKTAHSQCREVMNMLLIQLKNNIPIIFDDFEVDDE